MFDPEHAGNRCESSVGGAHLDVDHTFITLHLFYCPLLEPLKVEEMVLVFVVIFYVSVKPVNSLWLHVTGCALLPPPP